MSRYLPEHPSLRSRSFWPVNINVCWIILQRRVRLLLKSIESHFVGKHQRMIVRILEMTSKGWTTFQKAKMKDVVSHLEGKITGCGGDHECGSTQSKFKEPEKHRLNSGYGTLYYLHLNPPRYASPFIYYCLL